MKKLLCLLYLCSLLTVSVQATTVSSLGWWNEDDPGTTHQYWDFTPDYVRSIIGDGYTASPEDVTNPNPELVIATISPGGAWDGQSTFTGSWIYVNLEIPNYDVLNPYKEIWVDIGGRGLVIDSIAVSAAGHDIKSTDYCYEVLQGQGDAEFGVRIWPNPELEKIGFMLTGAAAPAMLDYIHVDTICIPEPATICMLSLGILSLIRRKK
ncbi:MAG: PEP-CTERM sorting domain-containing protein [Sedimentisphaerales bacterium]|nr:PEP-CTERM sorting domain-containing protein [Sedimentisphaerales bacterium]